MFKRNGPVTCENYHITKQDLQITAVAHHFYPSAGIKINTPNHAVTGCTFNATTGYCLFSMSNTIAATLQVGSHVPKQNQSISFTSIPPSPSTVGGTYTVSATGGASGNPVVFSIDGASTSGTCSISGNLVLFANAGTCIVNANQAGNTQYNAAPQVQQIITVNKIDQPIMFTSTPTSRATCSWCCNGSSWRWTSYCQLVSTSLYRWLSYYWLHSYLWANWIPNEL